MGDDVSPDTTCGRAITWLQIPASEAFRRRLWPPAEPFANHVRAHVANGSELGKMHAVPQRRIFHCEVFKRVKHLARARVASK